MTTRKHDNYFRYVFSDVKRMAEFLNLLAIENKSLARFMDTIDIETLTEISESFSDMKSYGYADLAFSVKLKKEFQLAATEGAALPAPKPEAELLVGILAEHKSAPKEDVIAQLVDYWFQIMVKKQNNIPTVAIIVYNGKQPWAPNTSTMFPNYPEYYQQIGLPFVLEFVDVGNVLEQENLQQLTPKIMLALVALKYVFHQDKHKERFKSAARAFLALTPQEQGDFFDKTLLYLKEIIPQKEKEEYMDFINVPEYYGYKSIAQAEREEWFADGRAEGFTDGQSKGFADGENSGIQKKARQMAKAMLADGLPISKIISYSGLSEKEIESL